MSETNESPCTKIGEFSWNELVTTDSNAASSFYGNLFGWQATPFAPDDRPAGAPPYTIFKTTENPMGVGGMAQIEKPGMPAQWIPYVVVDDVDASLAKAVDLGATIILPVMPIPHVGRIAVIADPQGATIGLHEFPKQ